MEKILTNLERCNICPHKCQVNRIKGQIGKCKSGNKVKIALYSIHNFEEPCISGKNGSGTIFFSNCNLNCVFCQNYEISQLGQGKEFEINELADIMIKEQEKGVENINLVTPTSYIIQIAESIKIAKGKGLKIPIVYNTNSYENIESLKLLDGLVDIYLPDLKYYYNKLGKRYSNVENYFEIATNAILEMYRQVGNVQIDSNGILQKGVVIRHLVLPNHIENSKKVLKWIKENIDNKVFVSIMAQYFPTYKAKNIEKINRKLTKKEYQEIMEYVDSIGLDNGYVQELGEHEEKYVPKWNI